MNSILKFIGRRHRALSGAAVLLAISGLGCGRDLTIKREAVINTEFDRNGVPMDVDIVMVYPSDFKGDLKDINHDLLPESGITADKWFANKPTPESVKNKEDTSHYHIPAERILSYAQKRSATYGKYLGGQLRGSKYDSKDIVVKNIPVADIWDDHSILYVFGRFTDANGAVIPTAPARFWKLGRYKEELSILIKAKSIERLTDPKLEKNAEESRVD